MTVECTEFEYCKVKVHYVADPDLVIEKRNEAILNIKKLKPKVPGFRAGKANATIIKQKFKKQISESVQRSLIAEAYDEVLFETKMKPIFYPEIHESRLDGNNFTCDLTFSKKPDFELKQYKGFTIPKPHISITANEMAEKMIQNLRVQHADPIPYGEDDVVQPGDQVTLDVTATDPNTASDLESLSLQGALYTIGQNPIVEIDQKMYGMKAGEEREFDIIFDDNDNYVEAIRGKRVKFNVKVHMGTKRTPLPLDDELAKIVGLETYVQLSQEAARAAQDKITSNQLQQVTDQLMMRILAEHEFDVPAWYVVMESQKIAASQNVAWEDLTDEQIDSVNAQSTNRIKLSLIFDSIRESEPDLIFSDQEMVNQIRAQLKAQGQNADEVLSSLAKDGTLIGTISAMKDRATVQWLIEQSKIVE